jgi:DNA-binding beta-propeller fold protein YncE
MVTVRTLLFVLISLVAIDGAWTSAGRAEDLGYKVLKRFDVGGEGGWDYLTMDSESRRLYISRSTRVQVFDVDEGKVIGEVSNTPGVHGIALVPKLGHGFTSNGQEGTVTVFDLKTLKELDRIKVGQNPDGIMYDPLSNRVFTFNGRSRDATAIDAETKKVAGTVTLGGKPESAVSDEQGQVYVNIEDKDEVVVFDARDLMVKHRWPVAPAKRPVGLAIDRNSHRLFISCGNEKMAVMDAETGRVLATPAIGKRTDFCVFDPDTKLAFSSNGGDGTLTVVHEDAPDKFSVVANVPTQIGARTCALDSKTHNIILVSARFELPPANAKGRQRPRMIRNSFVVLVVGKG